MCCIFWVFGPFLPFPFQEVNSTRKRKKIIYIYIYDDVFFGQFYGEKKGNQNFYFLSPCYIIEVSLSLFLSIFLTFFGRSC